MAIYRTRRMYSIKTLGGNKVASGKILNTRGVPGFDRNRKYDTDLDRLGRMETAQRELNNGPRQVREELRKMHNELNGSI